MSTDPSQDERLGILWEGLRNGNQHAFSELVRDRYKVMFNYSLKFTKDRELIKDCIQDFWMDLWSNNQSIRPVTYVTVYLLTSLRNNLIRKVNNKKVFASEDPSEIHDLTDGNHIEMETIWLEMTHEKKERLQQAIENLSVRQQEVIFLKFYEGLSTEEISHIMGIGRQPVSNLVQKALIRLRETVAYNFFFLLLVVFCFLLITL